MDEAGRVVVVIDFSGRSREIIAASRWEALIAPRFFYEACSRLTVITSSAASGSIADSGTVTVAIESPKALNTSSTQPRSPPAGCST